MAEKADPNVVYAQLATRIPKELHQGLKVHCVKTDVSVMAFTIRALTAQLEKERASLKAAKK